MNQHPNKDLNIYQRINLVIKELLDEGKGYLKQGSAGQGTGVKYDNVISVLAPKLVKYGVDVTVTLIADSDRELATSKGGKMYIYKGFYNIRYTNIDDPKDCLNQQITGEGMDTGDKAPGKAITYATKIAYVKKFSFEGGINDESVFSPVVHDCISEEQYSEIYPLITENDGILSKFGESLSKAYKFKLIADIKSSQYNEILSKLNKKLGSK